MNDLLNGYFTIKDIILSKKEILDDFKLAERMYLWVGQNSEFSVTGKN